ncbi:MAG: hypothetical protein ABIV25_00120 [Paracoccaceae bacterium]
MPTDRFRVALLTLLIGGSGGLAQADAPLSAIDWLSESLVTPIAQPAQNLNEPAVTKDGAAPEGVTTSALDQASPDAVGILPPQVTGLPRNLWGMAHTADVEALLTAEAAQDLPALQGLLITLLLAESEPPADAGGNGALLLARLDKLLSIGALDQARALLDAAGPTTTPELFRRYFDASLLIGDEDKACKLLHDAPGLSPALPTRIFCLARAGDFDAAGLTLDTARALGTVTPEDADLLARFMNPDLDEAGGTLTPPSPLTPLTLRLFEAVGEPLPIATLPIAFSYADLSENAGWKAQIEAAERLSRASAIAPNMLLGLYTQQKPAASGGVWDRVATFQKLDRAIASGDVKAVELALPAAWAEMTSAELEVPLATIYADKLAHMPLTGDAAAIAFHISLLSPDYETLSALHTAASAQDMFLSALAKGNLASAAPPDSMARAIAPAFLAPVVSDDFKPLLDQNRIGEVILQAMIRIDHGTAGDLRGVTDGLSVLRHIGLEDVARRTALQLMLLDRRG